MKNRKTSVFAAILLLLALSVPLLTACGEPVLSVTENTGRLMTIRAERAAKNSFFMLGTLNVDEGEQIVLTAALKKGSIRIEIIPVPPEQSITEVPEMDGGAILTANLKTTESAAATFPAGDYLVRATSLETATGTVRIEVLPTP